MSKTAWHRNEMRRLYRALRDGRFDLEVGWFREDLRGRFVPDGTGGGAIRVNPFVHTVEAFIHEAYHFLDPRAGEQAVVNQENAVFRPLSVAQQQRIFRHIQRRWLDTMAHYRARGRTVPPCPLCGQDMPHDVPGD